MSDTSSDDQSGIPRLNGASNFYAWKVMVQIHLVSLDVWNITSGAIPRPSGPTPDASTLTSAQNAWDQLSFLARCFLDRHMSAKIQSDMFVHDTAPEMWKALMDSYLQRNSRSLMNCFNAIRSLQYSDTGTESFPDYLASFEKHWQDLLLRTYDADAQVLGLGTSLETALRVVALSDEAKREFLVASLPPSMMDFVVDLSERLGSELDYLRLYRELIMYHSQVESQREEPELE